MGNNVYGAIALKTSSGALDQIDGVNLLAGDIALVVTDTNSYFYKLFVNDVSQENSPYIIQPVLNGSNKRWKLTSISETSSDLNVVGKLITDMFAFSGNTLTIVTGSETLATFNKNSSSVSFKKIASVEDSTMVNGLNAQYVGGRDGTKMMLSDGSIAFEAPVSGTAPTLDSHLTTKSYVDDLIAAIDNSVATDFLVNNQLTVSNITTPIGNDLVIKTNGPTGTTLATFDGSSVSFKKISSVEDTSMVNGLNAEFIRGTTLDSLLKADGSIPFTAPIRGQHPTLNTHLATKGYADSADLTKASKGANSDITSLSGLTTPLSVAQGGTGGTTALGTAAYVNTGSNTGNVPVLAAGGKLDAGVLPAASNARAALELGDAATLNVGTGAGNLLQLNDSGKIPAVPGDLITGLTASQISGLSSGMPTGAVVAVASSSVPSGFLECNGAAVSRTAYAALFAAIAVAHGYGDNASTFNLPDYRGRFLRGWDHAIARDPDRASRTAMNTGGAAGDTVGSVQVDAFKSHTHGLNISTEEGGYPNPPISGQGGGTLRSTASAGGNETRPINANVMYCIKY